ncbi:hypothetical protein SteCoe_9850 [Stentor coeruleus]|uniref:Cyclin-like domain-containing protein n=1 Tax=Stentor coeruleus TaxID=5963 RepID=A0A1R2CGW2_9CILI|nr:hypothetical protein SteCoe_9850 [Stentor coeruleus]
MLCKHSWDRKKIKSRICKQCGAFAPSSGAKVVREVQYFIPIQDEPEEIVKELRIRQRKVNLDNQSYLENRKALVEWIIELCESYKLRPLTIHLSIYLMDQSHSLSKIPKILYQSIALACIIIICKTEQSEKMPDFQELSQLTSFNLKSLEVDILLLVNWKTHITTALHFLEFYCSSGFVFDNEVTDSRICRIAREYAELLLDLCIAENRFLMVFPEDLALTCLAVAREKIGLSQPWNNDLKILTGAQLNSSLYTEILDFYKINFPESY